MGGSRVGRRSSQVGAGVGVGGSCACSRVSNGSSGGDRAPISLYVTTHRVVFLRSKVFGVLSSVPNRATQS